MYIYYSVITNYGQYSQQSYVLFLVGSFLLIIKKYVHFVISGSLPGVPGRVGPQPPTLPRPRYDLIGPGVNPYPDPALIPRRPSPQGRGGRGGHFGGFGPRFF